MTSKFTEQYRHSGADGLAWSDIRHFTRKEWQGHLPETSALLVCALDEYRQNLGSPVWISPANWGTHGETSYHYPSQRTQGKIWAVDIFPDCDLSWAYHIAVRSKVFGAVGVYPYAKYPAKKLKGLLHLDIRHYASLKKIWWRDPVDVYHYVHNNVELSHMEIAMLAGGIG